MPSFVLKKIALKTSEGEIFKVNDALLRVSLTIKLLVDEKGIDSVISLPEILSKALFKIAEYLKMHVEFDAAASKSDDKSFEAWGTQFIMNVEMDTIYKLVLASQYLNITELFVLACDNAAERTMDWTLEEKPKTFYLDNVFEFEEE